MMDWHWYVSRSREIFLDLDSRKAVTAAVLKLRRAKKRGMLPAKERPLVYRSNSKNKYHMIIFLTEDWPADRRARFALWLGSDFIRGLYTLERIARGVRGADLLIVRGLVQGWREPDAACHCPEKHNRDRITKHCPVLRDLQGSEAGAEYFPVNNDARIRTKPLRITVNGRVPWSQILNY